MLLFYYYISASSRTEVADHATQEYIPAAVVVGKRRLAEALSRYEQNNTLL